MFNDPYEEIERRKKKSSPNLEITPLFTRSRILFLISIFLVVSMPLIYRYLSYLL